MKKLMFVFAAILLMVGTSVKANPSDGAMVVQEYSVGEFEEYTYLFPEFKEVQAMTLMYSEGLLFLEVKGRDNDGIARLSNHDVSGCSDCAAQCPDGTGAGSYVISDGIWAGGNWCACCPDFEPEANYALTDVFSYMGMM